MTHNHSMNETHIYILMHAAPPAPYALDASTIPLTDRRTLPGAWRGG